MKNFKKAVILSAEIREASWVNTPEKVQLGHYKIDLHESSIAAVKQLNLSEEMAYPIYLLLTTAWNDISDWAKGEESCTSVDRIQTLLEENRRLKVIITEREMVINQKPNSSAIAAILYAVQCNRDDGFEFIMKWNEGEFEWLRECWDNIPEEVFIGADPLHKDTKTVGLPTDEDAKHLAEMLSFACGGISDEQYDIWKASLQKYITLA